MALKASDEQPPKPSETGLSSHATGKAESLAMHLVYIDDSKEKPVFTFSALVVPSNQWNHVFSVLKDFRGDLKLADGIPLYRELHASEFLGGRGNLSRQVVTKKRRLAIFLKKLHILARLEPVGVRLLNVSLGNEFWAFERLLNRINRCMAEWDSHAVLICDEGKEDQFTRLRRRMSVHNPIPSKYGAWGGGQRTRNIPLDRIIEDLFFKQSHRSYMIQAVDFCAYALLRRERVLPRKGSLHTALEILEPICIKAANPKDPLGIIR